MFTVKIWFYLIQKDLFKILYWEKDTWFSRYRLIHFTLWDQGLTGGIDPWMGQFTSSCQQSSVPGHCHWQAISVLCKVITEKMPKLSCHTMINIFIWSTHAHGGNLKKKKSYIHWLATVPMAVSVHADFKSFAGGIKLHYSERHFFIWFLMVMVAETTVTWWNVVTVKAKVYICHYINTH